LPGTVASTAQRKQSGVKDGHGPQACKHAQPLTARTPWYGEGNSKTAYTPPTPRLHPAYTPPTARPRAFGASGARRPTRAEGVRDQSRMAATRDEARGAARESDGGTPGRYPVPACCQTSAQRNTPC